MRPTSIIVGAALCLALGAGCAGGGEDKSEADLTADLATELQDADPDLSDDAADCWAAVWVDELGAEQINDLDLSADEPPEEIREDLATAAIQARSECDLDR
jgi:hypothetical protein